MKAFLRTTPFTTHLALPRFTISRSRWLVAGAVFLTGAIAASSYAWFTRTYQVSALMNVPIQEFSQREYPANPADFSPEYGRYGNRTLSIVQRDDYHFDFVLEPTNEQTAKIVIKNVDLRLMVPSQPAWTKNNAELTKQAFFDREWNRQQVSFDPKSNQIEITDGNGFEIDNLVSIELANNCLDAGYWEVLFFVKDPADEKAKKLYYQGWFTLPKGHYKSVFESVNQTSYWQNAWHLERFSDVEGMPADLNVLRSVTSEQDLSATFLGDEAILVTGEQQRKLKILDRKNLHTWNDLYRSDQVAFTRFVAPGRYEPTQTLHPKFNRIANLNRVKLREIQSPANPEPLQELEFSFTEANAPKETRLVISGLDLANLPQLPTQKYNKGLYMPLGLAVPPTTSSYSDLEKHPPAQSPYFGLLLDAEGRRLNHLAIGLNGIVLHRDETDPTKLHFYFLSYERETLVGHYVIQMPSPPPEENKPNDEGAI